MKKNGIFIFVMMMTCCAMNVAADNITITLTAPTTPASVAVGSTLDLMSCAAITDAGNNGIKSKFVKAIDYNTAEKSSISRYLKFTSSNPMVAGVNPDGTLYGLTPGTSTVTISGATVDGYNNFYTLSAAVTAVSFDVTVTGTAPATTWTASDARLRYWNFSTDAAKVIDADASNYWKNDTPVTFTDKYNKSYKTNFYTYQPGAATSGVLLKSEGTNFFTTYSDSRSWTENLQFEKDADGILRYDPFYDTSSELRDDGLYLNSHARLIIKDMKDGEVVTVRGTSYSRNSLIYNFIAEKIDFGKYNEVVSASDCDEANASYYSDAIDISYPCNILDKKLFAYHKNTKETSEDKKEMTLSGSFNYLRGATYSVTVGYPAVWGTYITTIMYDNVGDNPHLYGVATYGSVDYAATLMGQQDATAYIISTEAGTDLEGNPRYGLKATRVAEVPQGTGVLLLGGYYTGSEIIDKTPGYLLYVAPGNKTTYTTVDVNNQVTNYEEVKDENDHSSMQNVTRQNCLYCSDGTFSITTNPMAPATGATDDNTYYYFILAKQTVKSKAMGDEGVNSHTIGMFQMLKPGTSVKKGKAYLKLPKSVYDKAYKVTYTNSAGASANFIPFYIQDTENPTGISSTTSEKAQVEDDAYYTLSGVKVNKADKKGIYIHHHQKIVVK